MSHSFPYYLNMTTMKVLLCFITRSQTKWINHLSKWKILIICLCLRKFRFIFIDIIQYDNRMSTKSVTMVFFKYKWNLFDFVLFYSRSYPLFQDLNFYVSRIGKLSQAEWFNEKLFIFQKIVIKLTILPILCRNTHKVRQCERRFFIFLMSSCINVIVIFLYGTYAERRLKSNGI